MITDPHLFFADISLDLTRGAFLAGMHKLETQGALFQDFYTFNLLHARALKGLGRFQEAKKALKTCCRIEPHNQIAWKELLEVHFLLLRSPEDDFTSELEELSLALASFEPPTESETSDPTPLQEQKQPFSDEESIPVPTETLAALFSEQGAYKKAIRIYTDLIQLNPSNADAYKNEISSLLDKL